MKSLDSSNPPFPANFPGACRTETPLGVVPGLFVVFGFTVEGDVLVPGVAGAGEFEPGMPPGVVAFGDDPFRWLCGDVCGVVCGVAGCADGVTVAGGGVAVWAGGVAVWAGSVAVWAGGVAVPGELWAIVQLAQQQSMNNNVIIFADITLVSKTDSLVLPSGFSGRAEMLRDHVAQDVLRKVQSEITLRWKVSGGCRRTKAELTYAGIYPVLRKRQSVKYRLTPPKK